MKIGIFGDSYAVHNELYVGEGWVSLMKNDHNFSVTLHSMMGVSGYWIYKEFMNNYMKYDKIIYIVTYPLRLSLSFLANASASNLEYHITKTSYRYSEEQLLVLKSIQDYLTYAITDTEIEDQHIAWHHLMLDKVKQTKKEILMIPAFNYTNSEFQKYVSLWDITIMEENAWGNSFKKYLSSRHNYKGDRRQCHLTETNNRILYQIISNQIKNLDDYEVLNIEKNQFCSPDITEPLEKYKLLS